MAQGPKTPQSPQKNDNSLHHSSQIWEKLGAQHGSIFFFARHLSPNSVDGRWPRSDAALAPPPRRRDGEADRMRSTVLWHKHGGLEGMFELKASYLTEELNLAKPAVVQTQWCFGTKDPSQKQGSPGARPGLASRSIVPKQSNTPTHSWNPGTTSPSEPPSNPAHHV